LFNAADDAATDDMLEVGRQMKAARQAEHLNLAALSIAENRPRVKHGVPASHATVRPWVRVTVFLLLLM
jgi:hypothetical protein